MRMQHPRRPNQKLLFLKVFIHRYGQPWFGGFIGNNQPRAAPASTAHHRHMQAPLWTRRCKTLKSGTTSADCPTTPASSFGMAATSGRAASPYSILLSFALSRKRTRSDPCGPFLPALAGLAASALSQACPTAALSRAILFKASTVAANAALRMRSSSPHFQGKSSKRTGLTNTVPVLKPSMPPILLSSLSLQMYPLLHPTRASASRSLVILPVSSAAGTAVLFSLVSLRRIFARFCSCNCFYADVASV